MGNKTGKFDVPTTEKVNKDEEVVVDETEPKLESANGIEANGDTSKPEGNGVGKSETATPAKKKNIVSWFKKMSIRKEKKPKAPKENGVKDAEIVGEDNNANGEIPSEKVESKDEVVVNHEEVKETVPEVVCEEETPVKEEAAPITSNNEQQQHVNCAETPTTAEAPNEEEQ